MNIFINMAALIFTHLRRPISGFPWTRFYEGGSRDGGYKELPQRQKHGRRIIHMAAFRGW
jgi:hypothetical protein